MTVDTAGEEEEDALPALVPDPVAETPAPIAAAAPQAGPEPAHIPAPPPEPEPEPEPDPERPKSPDYEAMRADPSKIPDMSAHAGWTAFRKCMTNSCTGSENQPEHVNCYQNVKFENIFDDCKMMLNERGEDDNFMAYFRFVFMRNEQAAFCKERWNGTYDDKREMCSVPIRFYRTVKEGKDKKSGCKNDVTKTFRFGISPAIIPCSYETFGLDDCYEENANYQIGQIQQWAGIVQIVGGAASGFAAGASAISANAAQKNQTAFNNNLAMAKTDPNGKLGTEDTKQKGSLALGITTGVGSGIGMAGEGAATIAKGAIMMGQHGDLHKGGRCGIPSENGESSIREGNTIRLSW